jgi:hypothetical protein
MSRDRNWSGFVARALAVLLASPVTAGAADWERVGTDADDNNYAVDTSRLVRDGSIVGASVRTEYAKPRPVEGVDAAVFVSLDRMLVDCSKASFGIESRTFVLADGTEVPRGITPRAEIRFRTAAAGSMSEAIVRFVCKAAGVTRPKD